MSEHASQRRRTSDEDVFDQVLAETEAENKPIEAYTAPERQLAVLTARQRRLGILAAAAGMLERIEDQLITASPPDSTPAPKPSRAEDDLIDA